MNKSQIKVFGMDHIHENTSITFTKEGLILSSGVNVTNDVARILTFYKQFLDLKGIVYKGEKMQVYRLNKIIPSSFINENTIINVQKELLYNAQMEIKTAKKYLL